MTLNEKQKKFTLLVARLIHWAYSKGYELTFGEAFRTQEQAALNAKKGIGIRNSLHCQRLAIDLNLFINGVYQPDSAKYKPLGEYWKSLDPDCCWGGDFKNLKDANHFSITHDGMK
ncbi:MAG: M15 family metallopeptidase [Gammaproteobacteria bacterium]|nr:M15 family metallopeptidase [Gammaproteobacteria bacterium]